MQQFLYRLSLACLFSLPLLLSAQSPANNGAVTDTFFGQPVPDPYRWMEDMNSDRMKEWLKAEDKMATAEANKLFLNGSNADIALREHTLFVFPDFEKQGPWYFYRKYTGNMREPSPMLFYRKKIYTHADVAFDPNLYNGSEIYAVTGYWLSDSNQYLAVSIAPSGSDVNTIYVRDLVANKTLDDKLVGVKYRKVVWAGNGFYYARYLNPGSIQQAAQGHELCYHKLGDPQDKDDEIMALPDYLNHTLNFSKSNDGRFLVLCTEQKIRGKWQAIATYKDLRAGADADWNTLASAPDSGDLTYHFVDAIDTELYFLTNYGAPNYRLLKINIAKPGTFVEVIPERDMVMLEVNHINHQLAVLYSNHGLYHMQFCDYTGKRLLRLDFDPGIAVHGFQGKPDDDETLFTQNSFFFPQVVYRYDFNTKKVELTDETTIGYDPTMYVSKLVSYHSADGTEIPMYLCYKKGLKLNGHNPVVMYGNGSFGMVMTPFFKLSNILLFENGGILAMPLIRGGGEMGGQWHNSARNLDKQRSFDDFIAAADYLIKENYTNKDRLAAIGINPGGGLLVGAVITQRPDLFKAVVTESGLFDMLRYNKSGEGPNWVYEFGTASNRQEFSNLLNYSPLNNVKPGVQYPATLSITPLNNAWVPPFHTYKFVAALQQNSAGNRPHLLFAEDNRGHFGLSERPGFNTQEAFIFSFIYGQMGLELKRF